LNTPSIGIGICFHFCFIFREREKIRQQLVVEKSKYEKGFWNTQCINLGGLGKEPSLSHMQQGILSLIIVLRETFPVYSFTILTVFMAISNKLNYIYLV